MRARIKANREHVITLAHQSEAMARQHRLKPLDHYLSNRRTRSGTDEGVFAMLEKLAAKGLVSIAERDSTNGG